MRCASLVAVLAFLTAGCSTSGSPDSAPATSPLVLSSAAPPASTPPPAPEPSRSTAASSPAFSSTPVSSSPAPSKPPVIDYTRLLAAIAENGDIVLIDPDTAAVIRTVIPHDAALPASSLAWDAPRQLMYFGRAGTCASVWRHRLGEEPVHRFSAGRRPVVSPDGTRLVAATACLPGQGADGITVRDTKTGATILELPAGVAAAPAPANAPTSVDDLDWRPDGGAVVVTVTSAGRTTQHLVDVRRPPRSVLAGKLVVVRPAPPETSYGEVAFVGAGLVVAGRCCGAGAGTPSARLFARDSTTGTLTAVATGPAFSMTADQRGRLRYLSTDSFERPAPLWAMDAIAAPPRQIGGLFRALSW